MCRWGSYEVKSALALSLATLMRSALVTHKSWLDMYSALQDTAEVRLDIYQAYISKRFSPRFWDTGSIAEALHEASVGCLSSAKLRGAGQAALLAFPQAQAESPRFPKGVQTILYDTLMQNLFADSTPALVQRRLSSLGIPAAGVPPLDFDRLRNQIRGLPEYVVFTILRSWANGWTTSHRMHEHLKQECLFGCADANDDLAHYLCCRRVWRALRSALRQTARADPPSLVSSQTVRKLCLVDYDPERILHLCCVSYSYHIIKTITGKCF